MGEKRKLDFDGFWERNGLFVSAAALVAIVVLALIWK